MTIPRKPTKTLGAGSTEWLTSLAQCIDSIGNEKFSTNLIIALKTLAEFDNSVAFAYYKSDKPLCLFHTFSTQNRVIFVDEYLKGPYLLDPFFKACGRRVDTGLYRLRDIAPDRFYQSEYYRSYYVRTGLSEEICYTFYLRHGVACVISLMRSSENTRFSAREFRLLKGVVSVVTSLAKQHWQDVAEEFDTGEDTESIGARSLIESTVSSLFSQRITPRETQVVAQVLEGHSSDAIAKDLGISVGTVRIHRRNIYAKLQISSQQELFSIFFKKITNSI